MACEYDAEAWAAYLALASPSTPSGLADGTLYCYGGCGTRYADFVSDVILPNTLWNRIAVGAPFDETEPLGDREGGRGGVLCPACITSRLAALPDRSVIYMTIDVPTFDWHRGVEPSTPSPAPAASSAQDQAAKEQP